jgi:hypothetical protein
MPGLGKVIPPPIRETSVAEWCGASNGLCVDSSAIDSKLVIPAIDLRALVSRDSSESIEGKIEGSLSASMVLPTPGGPTKSI